MNEQQFADIGAACDRLLRAPNTNLGRLAIPELHFLNEHPSCLAPYAALLSGNSGGFLDIPRAVFRAVRGLARSLAAPRAVAPPRGPIDVLIVSHLLKPSQLRQGDDFYFGSLQSHLQDYGVTSLLVLINHLAGGRTEPDAPTPPFPRMTLAKAASRATELCAWRECMVAWGALRREAADARNSADHQLAAQSEGCHHHV
jgi:hypothetical protein